jgi:hypothetical protein
VVERGLASDITGKKKKAQHPGGMPEVCAMWFSGIPPGCGFICDYIRWCRSQSLAQPPDKFWQASGLLQRHYSKERGILTN